MSSNYLNADGTTMLNDAIEKSTLPTSNAMVELEGKFPKND